MIRSPGAFPQPWLSLVVALASAVAIGPEGAMAQSLAPEAGLTSALGGQEHGAAGEWALSLGVGAGFAPDYEGSEDYAPVPLLFARIQRGETYVSQLCWQHQLEEKVEGTTKLNLLRRSAV